MQSAKCGLTADNRLALLMHEAVTSPYGKMGFGLMRYGAAPVVAVIDRFRGLPAMITEAQDQLTG